MASISPGVSSVIDFLIAAAGNSRAPAGGFNVDLFGGLENLEHNDCVPMTAPPALPTIPHASLLEANAHPDGHKTTH